MSYLRKLGQFDYHHTLTDTPGDALVMFSTAACGSCRQFRQLLQTHADKLGALTVFEVDAEQELALTREFDIFHLPAFFLYRDGKFHAPLQSTASILAFSQAIDTAYAQPAQEEP